MMIVQPITVSDADYTGGNLVENDTVDAPEWADNTAYERGDAVRIESTHAIYDCLADHTSADGTNDPLTEAAALADSLTADPDPQHWIYRSQTNKYRLFDGRPSQQALAPAADEGDDTVIEVEITLPSRMNAIALVELTDASEVTIDLIDDAGDTYWTRTIDLTDTSLVNDWLSYFYAPNRLFGSYVNGSLPIASIGDELHVTVTGGENLAVGQIVMGQGVEIGFVREGETGFEGLDFSHVETNYAGDLVTVRRAATTIQRFDVQLPTADLNILATLLHDLRGGRRALFIGVDRQGPRIWQYGFARRYRAYPIDNVTSRARITCQGVV